MYVNDTLGNQVTVIDGATNTVEATLPGGNEPDYLSLNAATNNIYVTDYSGNAVTIINGATDATASAAVGGDPTGLALDPLTNLVYTSNQVGTGSAPSGSPGATISVINGASNAVQATLTIPGVDGLLAVNPVTNTVYSGDYLSLIHI